MFWKTGDCAESATGSKKAEYPEADTFDAGMTQDRLTVHYYSLYKLFCSLLAEAASKKGRLWRQRRYAGKSRSNHNITNLSSRVKAYDRRRSFG